MVGLIGFGIAALVIFLYAYSIDAFHGSTKTFDIKTYYIAYLCLAAALVIWAVGTQLRPSGLKAAVILGDILVLTTTVLLARIITPKKYLNQVTVAAGLVAIAALIYRAANLHPVMKDGVLIFYTPRVFGALLILALLFVWLRVNNKLFDDVISKHRLAIERSTYFSSNFVGYIGVCGFLFARKSITIIVAFSMFIFSFLMLLVLNLYFKNMPARKVSRAAAK